MSSSAEVSGVSIDKADKEMFGADEGGPITKADLAQYYADVAEVMLPHCQNRPDLDAAIPRWDRLGVLL